tara:strand:+ start:129 stop:461 length:333 start_codon:yes stop_codon:yes gene_type:complete
MKLRTHDGVVVANLVGTTVVKIAKEKIHMLQKPPSWSFDRNIIDDAYANGATDIRIETTDTNKVYKSSIKNFIDKAIALDRGFGRQVALPIEDWTTITPEGKQMSLFMDK